MKKQILKARLLSAFILLISLLFSAPMMAGNEHYFNSLSGHTMDPGDTLSVTDSHFPDPPYPGSGSWSNGFVNYKVNNRVELVVNDSGEVCLSDSFTMQVVVLIKYWDAAYNQYTTQETLMVNYNSRSGVNFIERAVYGFTGAHHIEAYVLSISNPSFKHLVKLEAYIDVERYYNFDFNTAPAFISGSPALASGDREITVTWTPVSGAEEYDLEWTWVDNYTGSINITGPILNTNLADRWYDFRGDATRITTTLNTYTIANAFESGYIIFRVRAVGYGGTDFKHRIAGNWNVANPAGTLNNIGASNTYIAVTSTLSHEQQLNWQFMAVYAEEGKKKESITYFDGSLRSRQVVTRLSSDDNAIVAETFYDHQGRAAIQALPAPVPADHLHYYFGFNRNRTGAPYSRNDFDLDSTGNVCIPAQGEMSPWYGASRYYSVNNPDQDQWQAYVPQAQRFPFVHTQYEPDNTGRIRRQSGAGWDHRLGSGHETQYFYGVPTQKELDRLFGTEVGYAAHYKKNMVIDANGQVSVSYLNAGGKVIATALAGDPPSNTIALPIPAPDEPVVFSDDLLISNEERMDEAAVIANFSLLVPADGEYQFTYTMKADTFISECTPSFCYDCVYDLEISVKDACGQEMMPGGLPVRKTIGQLVADTFDVNCENNAAKSYSTALDNTLADPTLTLNLEKGSYQVTKRLMVNQDAMEYYLQRYLEASTCISTPEDYVVEGLANADTTGCDYEFDCDSCIARLGSPTAFLNKYLTGIYDPLIPFTAADTAYASEQYDQLVSSCREMCDTPDLCAGYLGLMVRDLNPGGQYGSLDPNDATSVFAPGTINVNNYQNPNIIYHNSDGSLAKITVQRTLPNNLKQKRTLSPNFLTREEFLAHWNPQWAYDMIVVHPEYCSYQWCIAQKASMTYDLNMIATESFADAKDSGFFNPLGLAAGDITYATSGLFSVMHKDPFFEAGTGSPGDNAQVRETMKYYMLYYEWINQHYGQPFPIPGISAADFYVSIWGAAAASVNCVATAKDNAQGYYDYMYCVSGHPFGTTYNLGNCATNFDLQWTIFRGIYQGIKQQMMDSLRKVHCNPSISSGKERIFVDVYEGLGVTKANLNADISTKADNSLTQSCDDQCNAYVSYWMQKLEGCKLKPGYDEQTIMNELVEICKKGCDVNHPLGASNVSPENEPSVTNKSFKEVLDPYFEAGVCDEALVEMPGPYGHDYWAYENPLQDTCACDAGLYNNLTDSCADTVTVVFDECYCAETDPELKQAMVLVSDPDFQYACKNCINCEEFAVALYEFDSIYGGLGYETTDINRYEDLFQSYMNKRFRFNLVFLEYRQFAADCLGEGDADDSTLYHYRQEWLPEQQSSLMFFSEGEAESILLGEGEVQQMNFNPEESFPPPGSGVKSMDTCTCNFLFQYKNDYDLLDPNPHSSFEDYIEDQYNSGDDIPNFNLIMELCEQSYAQDAEKNDPYSDQFNGTLSWVAPSNNSYYNLLEQIELLGATVPDYLTCDLPGEGSGPGGPCCYPSEDTAPTCLEMQQALDDFDTEYGITNRLDYYTAENSRKLEAYLDSYFGA